MARVSAGTITPPADRGVGTAGELGTYLEGVAVLSDAGAAYVVTRELHDELSSGG